MLIVDDLLYELQEAAGCDYVSDLPFLYRIKSNDLKRAVRSIPVNKYSLQEWNKAVTYITGRGCGFTSVSEAVDGILMY